MAKFKVGDRVTIVSKVPADKNEYPCFVDEMKQHLGKQGTISTFSMDRSRQSYVLDIGFTWYEGWLRPAGQGRERRRLLCA